MPNGRIRYTARLPNCNAAVVQLQSAERSVRTTNVRGIARLCPAPLVWYAASCVALSRRCSFSCLATCPCHQPRWRDCKVLRHCKSHEQAQVSTSCSVLLRYTYCSCTYSCMVLASFWRGRYSSEGRTSRTSATPSPLRSTPPPPRSESNIFSS
jgi:hypothetical protein